MTLPVRIRPLVEGDLGFVVDAWRRSFAESDVSELHRVDAAFYAKFMGRYIGKLMREDGARARVACDVEDADALAGFAVLTGPELHYVYVRGGNNSLRGHGVARALLEDLDVRAYTFRTAAGQRRLKPKARGWAFTPRFTL